MVTCSPRLTRLSGLTTGNYQRLDGQGPTAPRRWGGVSARVKRADTRSLRWVLVLVDGGQFLAELGQFGFHPENTCVAVAKMLEVE
jgi:hypothetical protein